MTDITFRLATYRLAKQFLGEYIIDFNNFTPENVQAKLILNDNSPELIVYHGETLIASIDVYTRVNTDTFQIENNLQSCEGFLNGISAMFVKYQLDEQSLDQPPIPL